MIAGREPGKVWDRAVQLLPWVLLELPQPGLLLCLGAQGALDMAPHLLGWWGPTSARTNFCTQESLTENFFNKLLREPDPSLCGINSEAPTWFQWGRVSFSICVVLREYWGKDWQAWQLQKLWCLENGTLWMFILIVENSFFFSLHSARSPGLCSPLPQNRQD